MNATTTQNPSELWPRTRLVLLALLAFCPYFVINRVTLDWPAHELSTAIDRLIPFQPIWEIIYVSIYFYIFIPVVYFRDLALLRRTVLAFCAIQLFSFTVFLALPVTLQRPELADINTHFLHWGVALNWLLDAPRNLFPSLHLANAFMVSLLLYRLHRAIGLTALIWASLIGYSTLAVKHHLLGDAIAGIALALIADRTLFATLPPTTLSRDSLYPSRYVAALAGLYPATLLLLFGLWRTGWRPFSWPAM